jgi:L-alanine-DL-glutamate epimerase-like enolase superfamily enzyme
MPIKSLAVARLRMPLTQPYTIAYETVVAAENILVRVQDESGRSGWGIAAPDPIVTGESLAAAGQALDVVIPSLVIGSDPGRVARLAVGLERLAAATPAARAAVEMAVLDLLGKRAGLPLYRLLGGYRTRILTSVTLGIASVADTLAEARERVRQGFRALKVKGGRDVGEDVERLVRTRELVGPRIRLRFDANQAYTAEEALTLIERTKAVDLEVIEQPTPREALRALRTVQRRSPIPVMADESLLGLNDAFRLARGRLADLVNVKLMKSGGVLAALSAIAVGRAAAMEVMVGCMDESELGIAAGLAVALARPGVVAADLDGHLDLVGDPASGILRLTHGTLHPSNAPGLGVRSEIEERLEEAMGQLPLGFAGP